MPPPQGRCSNSMELHDACRFTKRFRTPASSPGLSPKLQKRAAEDPRGRIGMLTAASALRCLPRTRRKRRSCGCCDRRRRSRVTCSQEARRRGAPRFSSCSSSREVAEWGAEVDRDGGVQRRRWRASASLVAAVVRVREVHACREAAARGSPERTRRPTASCPGPCRSPPSSSAGSLRINDLQVLLGSPRARWCRLVRRKQTSRALRKDNHECQLPWLGIAGNECFSNSPPRQLSVSSLSSVRTVAPEAAAAASLYCARFGAENYVVLSNRVVVVLLLSIIAACPLVPRGCSSPRMVGSGSAPAAAVFSAS